jgi:flagellar biosynthetic protein FliR
VFQNILPAPYDSQFMLFFFIYVRVSAAVFSTPVLDNTLVSGSIRAGIAFWIAVILIGPAWGLHQTTPGTQILEVTQTYNGVIAFMLAVGGEVLIGMTLGFIANVLLQTIGLAGEIIGQQAGFSAASVFDPITGQDIFLIAQINTLLGTMIFLLINGPETVISIVADSFSILPPGGAYSLAAYGETTYNIFLDDQGWKYAMASILFKVGIQLAAPIIGAMMLINLAEAFIARTVPQLNIMVVGFALRISLSLLILSASMPYVTDAFKQHLYKFTIYAQAFLYNMKPS